jgi:hypothetical protein
MKVDRWLEREDRVPCCTQNNNNENENEKTSVSGKLQFVQSTMFETKTHKVPKGTLTEAANERWGTTPRKLVMNVALEVMFHLMRWEFLSQFLFDGGGRWFPVEDLALLLVEDICSLIQRSRANIIRT